MQKQIHAYGDLAEEEGYAAVIGELLRNKNDNNGGGVCSKRLIKNEADDDTNYYCVA